MVLNSLINDTFCYLIDYHTECSPYDNLSCIVTILHKAPAAEIPCLTKIGYINPIDLYMPVQRQLLTSGQLPVIIVQPPWVATWVPCWLY